MGVLAWLRATLLREHEREHAEVDRHLAGVDAQLTRLEVDVRRLEIEKRLRSRRAGNGP